MLAVFRRELKAYFTSPIGFIVRGVLHPHRGRVLRHLQPAVGQPRTSRACSAASRSSSSSWSPSSPCG